MPGARMSIGFSLKIRLFWQIVRKTGRLSRETPSPTVSTVFFTLPRDILGAGRSTAEDRPAPGKGGKKCRSTW